MAVAVHRQPCATFPPLSPPQQQLAPKEFEAMVEEFLNKKT